MKKQLLILGIIILVTAGLSGCNVITNSLKPDTVNIIGTWITTINTDTVTMIFFSNKTVQITAVGTDFSGSYEIKDGNLVFTSGLTGMETYYYSFSSDGKKLTLRKLGENSDIIYTKQ